MILFSHPIGNANVRHAAVALAERDLLAEFWTCVSWNAASPLNRILPSGLREQLARRALPEILRERVHHVPWREAARMLAGRFGGTFLGRHEHGPLCIDAVFGALDRRVARRLRIAAHIRGVYAYEDGAAASFRAARERGQRCIYDLPIAYWRFMHTLLREEAERWPAWKQTLGGTRDSAVKLDRKDEELALAHAIVTPSQFVRKSLRGQVPGTPILVAEFGSPEIELDETLHAERMSCVKAGEPMRVLFAGSMSQRKGLADLFAAMHLLKRNDVELIVMGSPAVPMEFYRKEYAGFHYEPTRSHSEVLRLMQRCHLLVLPSIAEGRALVQQEAMSCGLPIIVTPNAGGEDLIVEGETGCLVPIRSPQAIADAIAGFADRRADWEGFSQAVCRKAAAYRWDAYGQKVVDFIRGVTHMQNAAA